MKVSKFEEKYAEIQKESKELYSQLKPLLSKFDKLSKKCQSLSYKVDNDKELYVYDDIKKDNVPVDNWDIGVLFRLGDFGYYNDSDWSEGIINLLYNLNHQPFYRKKAKYTPKNEETTY